VARSLEQHHAAVVEEVEFAVELVPAHRVIEVSANVEVALIDRWPVSKFELATLRVELGRRKELDPAGVVVMEMR
jgi:hypothetical protein